MTKTTNNKTKSTNNKKIRMPEEIENVRNSYRTTKKFNVISMRLVAVGGDLSLC